MAKKNMSLTKVPMPEQAPDVRNKNFDEKSKFLKTFQRDYGWWEQLGGKKLKMASKLVVRIFKTIRVRTLQRQGINLYLMSY